ncbi:MAG: hypothetical protein OEY78_04515 [Gammaproteobacteria bacterium]|nr:hypothetical protein [Gammaproteobacteria bacterium]
MENMTGKKFILSGMTLEVVSDAGDKWEMCNITTKETIFMEKSVLDNAIKLGKADEVTG